MEGIIPMVALEDRSEHWQVEREIKAIHSRGTLWKVVWKTQYMLKKVEETTSLVGDEDSTREFEVITS